jgi:4-amino-4-deoxy-L-arabinose transferase-like glycosyltransferase
MRRIGPLDAPLVLILIAYLGLAGAFARATPLYESTDELRHFRYIRYLQTYHALPEQTGDPAHNAQAHHPPLYYAVAALISGWVPLTEADPVFFDLPVNPFWGYRYFEASADNKAQFLHGAGEAWPFRGNALIAWLARLTSTIFGLGLAWVSYKLGEVTFPGRPAMALGGAAFVVFNPNVLHLAASINNDVPAAFFGALALYHSILILREGNSVRRAAFLGAALALGLMTKTNAIAMLAPAGLAISLAARRERRWRPALQAIAVVGLSLAVIAGWWFVRNLRLYGDLTGTADYVAVWRGEADQARLFREMISNMPYAWTTLWGRFGYGQAPLADWMYQAGAVLLGIAAMGHILPASADRTPFFSPTRSHARPPLGPTGRTRIGLRQFAAPPTALPAPRRGRSPRSLRGQRGLRPGPQVRGRCGPGAEGADQAEPEGNNSTGLPAPLGGCDASGPPPGAGRPDEGRFAPFLGPVGSALALAGPSACGVRGGPEVSLRERAEVWLVLLAALIASLAAWVLLMITVPATANARMIFAVYPVLGLLVVAGLTGWARLAVAWRRRRVEAPSASSGSLVAGALAVGLFAYAGVAYVGYLLPAFARPSALNPSAVAREATSAGGASLGGVAEILGYRASADMNYPGEAVHLTIYWRPLAITGTPYTVFIHLIDEDGIPIAQRHTYPGLGNYPTTAWQPGEVFADTYRVDLPETAYAPDQGEWRVGLFDLATGERLPVLDPASGEQVGDSVPAGLFQLNARAGPAPNAVGLNFGGRIELAGYELDSRTVEPGGTVQLTAYWQSLAVESDYWAFAHAVGDDGSIWGISDSVILPPATAWLAGEVVAETRALKLAPDTPPGLYDIYFGVTRVDGTGQDRLHILGRDGHEVDDHVILTKIRVAGG